MAKVCVDASLALAWVLPTPKSVTAERLWDDWSRQGAEIIGPPLLYIEATSVLRVQVYQGRLSPEEGQAAFDSFCGLGISSAPRLDLHLRAWRIAAELNHRNAYDAHYLALAEAEGCELWTLDQDLYRSAAQKFPWVKLVTKREVDR